MRMRGIFAAAIAIACLGLPAPVFALPAATVTLTASPNPSVTTATFKIVIKLSAEATNLQFHLETTGGFGDPDGSVCNPAANCTIFGGANAPHWTYPTASGTVTATFETEVNPGMVVRFYSDGGMSVTNPPSIRMKDPTPNPTATPRPKPTPTRTPKPTVVGPAVTTAATTAVPTAAPTPTEGPAQSVAPVASVPGASIAPSEVAALATPSVTGAPEATPVGADATSGFMLGLGLVLLVGLAGVGLLRRRMHGPGAAA